MVDPWLEWSAYAQRRLNYSAGDIQVVRYPLKMPDGSVLQRTSDLKAINNRAEAHIGDKARRMGGAQSWLGSANALQSAGGRAAPRPPPDRSLNAPSGHRANVASAALDG